jgi:lactose/L-arabinose transport system permease protein
MIWRWLGYDTILMMAGISSINTELFDAAAIDGAGSTRIFLRITLPLMKNSILFTCIMSTIGTFSMFTEPKILTAGGPLNSTISTVLHIYNNSFMYLKMGYSSSMSIVYFLIMLILTALQLRIGNHEKSSR